MCASSEHPAEQEKMAIALVRDSISLGMIGLVGCILAAGCNVQTFGSEPDSNGNYVLWTAGGEVSGQPATDGPNIYYGTRDHQVVAVNRETGIVLWQSRTDAPTPKTLNGQNIVLAAGNVIFGDYSIYAFDPATGSRRWVFDPQAQGIPGYAPGAYEQSSDGLTLYAGSGSGHVYAINALDGTLVWINPLSVDGQTSVYDPVIDGAALYVTVRHFTNPITGAVVALDRNDGTIIWSHSFPSEAPTSSGPLGKVVPFASTIIVGKDDGKIYALDKSTGEIRWTAPRRPDVIGYDDLRPIVLAGNVLVAGSLAHYLTGYDPATGRQLWEVDGGEGSAGNPLASDGVTVFEPYNGGTLGAFDVTTGAKRWIRSAPGKGWFTSYPLVAEAEVFAPSTRGLVALKK
jgi:outer membrane protein assembly factor BamB